MPEIVKISAVGCALALAIVFSVKVAEDKDHSIFSRLTNLILGMIMSTLAVKNFILLLK